MKKTVASPFVAAVVGGVVVAAAFLALGVDGSTTKTVVQQSSVAPRAVADGKALTARAIYKRDAPGVVPGLQAPASAPRGFPTPNVTRPDAAINRGTSGGPLRAGVGRGMGINWQIATGDGTAAGGGGNVGIGFAVPINTAKKVLPQLKQNGRVQRAYLGITGVTIDKSLDRLNLASQSGVLVQSVSPGSPAAKAGIRGGDAQTTLDGSSVQLGGDVITKIDGKTVGSMDDVISAIADRKPGDSVSLEYLRNKTSKTTTITLTQRPATVPQQ